MDLLRSRAPCEPLDECQDGFCDGGACTQDGGLGGLLTGLLCGVTGGGGL